MNLADRIVSHEESGLALRLLPSPVDDVVSLMGSFETGLTGVRDGLVQDLVVSLLDKGTRGRDKYEIAAEIEGMGAELGFTSNALRVGFSAKCLSGDVERLLALIAEQLKEPRFDEEEFAKAKVQLASHVRRGLESTTLRSRVALVSRLFDEDHPNYAAAPEVELELLDGITLDTVAARHREEFSGRRFCVSAAGDLDPAVLARSAVDQLASLADAGQPAGSEADFNPVRSTLDDQRRIDVPMADRNNLDVQIGAAVDIRRTDPDFVPLRVGDYILGGNFSARLMSYVREQKGLTYGIRSSLVGFDRRYSGYWQIGVTLSRENLAEGIGATQETIDGFLSGGVTPEELDSKKQTLTGLYKVALSTTRGLADTMLAHFRLGFDPDYVDSYPQRIRELEVEEVNRAIETYLVGRPLVTAVAGTLPD